MGLTTFDNSQGWRPSEQVDELASVTYMTGDASLANQADAARGWWHDPTKSLIALWVVVLALYWILGYLFRGARA
jgi:hypothetical protein